MVHNPYTYTCIHPFWHCWALYICHTKLTNADEGISASVPVYHIRNQRIKWKSLSTQIFNLTKKFNLKISKIDILCKIEQNNQNFSVKKKEESHCNGSLVNSWRYAISLLTWCSWTLLSDVWHTSGKMPKATVCRHHLSWSCRAMSGYAVRKIHEQSYFNSLY